MLSHAVPSPSDARLFALELRKHGRPGRRRELSDADLDSEVLATLCDPHSWPNRSVPGTETPLAQGTVVNTKSH